MSAEQNKAMVRRWVDGGWNSGDLSLVDEMYAPNYMIHDPSQPDFSGGAEAFKGFVSAFRAGLPDIHFKVEELVAEGDMVAWRFTTTGTHEGELLGIPPTGKRTMVTGLVISRFEGGKWAEDYVNWDTLGMLQQLGAIPAPQEEPAGVAR